MSTPSKGRFTVALFAGGLLTGPLAIATAPPAQAAGAEDRITRFEAQLAAQDLHIADQDRRLSEQQAMIEIQGAEILELKHQRDQILAEIRAGQRTAPAESGAPPPIQLAAQQTQPGAETLPARPVGEAPPPARLVEDVAALPEGLGVLTPKGALVLEPSFEFTRSSADRLVFRGVEIVPGIQLGVIDANTADRNALAGAFTMRYGVTNRLEIEARAPYVYRNDRVTTLAQRDSSVTRTTQLEGQDIGDVEFAGRYQITRGLPGDPIFVANLRVKPPTGKSPYDVDYDQFGVATSLATGSGFWAIEGGATMLYPTDPAVIFASLGYIYNASRNINKIIGTVPVGVVNPGDSIGASLGFGLALNPRFSVSLGYSHNFIFGTSTELGGTKQTSNSLQVGSLQMGMSFRLTPRATINTNFEFGVTSEAPDMRFVLRVPYIFF